MKEHYYLIPRYSSRTEAKLKMPNIEINTTDNSIYLVLPNSPKIPIGGQSGTQVQADWNQASNDSVDYIKNKPTIVSNFIGLSDTPSTYTANKILGVNSAGNGVIFVDFPTFTQTQADWNQATSSAVDFIKNKPTLVTNFLGLSDTPANYTSAANKMLTVNSAGNAIVFTTVPTFTQTQADWNQASNDSVDYIKNKPTIVSNFIGLSDTPSAYTANKLLSVNSTGDGVIFVDVPTFTQVQADWGQDKMNAVDYIKNKPTIISNFIELSDTPSAYTANKLLSVNSAGNGVVFVDVPTFTQTQVDWNQVTSGAVDFIKNKPTLVTNFLGLSDTPANYTSAANKMLTVNAAGNAIVFTTVPTFTQTQADWNQATTNAVDYINNKPIIPTNTNQLVNGNGFISSIVTISEKSSNYIISSGDVNVYLTHTIGVTEITVPSNNTASLAIGTTIVGFTSSEITFGAESGVTIISKDNKLVSSKNVEWRLIKIAIDTWVLSGHL